MEDAMSKPKGGWRQQAWAVIDEQGLVDGLNYQLEIYADRAQAAMACVDGQQSVEVTIVWEEK
jgi:hypothetical protein